MRCVVLCLMSIALSACAASRAAVAPTVASPAAHPKVPPTGPWLWKIRRGDAVSYLFVAPTTGIGAQEIPDTVWQALTHSRSVMFEYAPESKAIAAAWTLPATTSLEDLLGSADYKQLLHVLPPWRARYLRHVAPAVAVSWLLRPWASPSSATAAVIKRALALKLPITYVSDQAAENVYWRRMYNDDFLRVAVLNLDQFRQATETVDASYRSGELVKLRRAAHQFDNDITDKNAIARYYVKRNPRRLAKLRPVLRQGGAFIVMSWDQVTRQQGLLQALNDAGYHLSRVGLGTPPTKLVTTHHNSVATCDRLFEFQFRLAKQSTDKRASWRRAHRPRFMNTCLGLAGTDLASCVKTSTTTRAAWVCTITSMRRELKRRGQDASVLSQTKMDQMMKAKHAELVTAVSVIADAACACTDKTCATGPAAALTRYVKKHKHHSTTVRAAAQVTPHVTRLMKCLGSAGLDMKKFAADLIAAGS